MAEATVTTDLGAPQHQVAPLVDLSVTIQTTDLSTQPRNPFQGAAIVTGQTQTPGAFLTTIPANATTPTTVPQSSPPTSSGDTWTFTFGSVGTPVPAGDYLFTVGASNGGSLVTQTIAVKLS
jgi:hypothetical protein